MCVIVRSRCVPQQAARVARRRDLIHAVSHRRTIPELLAAHRRSYFSNRYDLVAIELPNLAAHLRARR
jgi:hypothetical protein